MPLWRDCNHTLCSNNESCVSARMWISSNHGVQYWSSTIQVSLTATQAASRPGAGRQQSYVAHGQQHPACEHPLTFLASTKLCWTCLCAVCCTATLGKLACQYYTARFPQLNVHATKMPCVGAGWYCATWTCIAADMTGRDMAYCCTTLPHSVTFMAICRPNQATLLPFERFTASVYRVEVADVAGSGTA